MGEGKKFKKYDFGIPRSHKQLIIVNKLENEPPKGCVGPGNIPPQPSDGSCGSKCVKELMQQFTSTNPIIQ